MNSSKDSSFEKRVSLLLADYLSDSPWKQHECSREDFTEISKTFLEICFRDLGLAPDKLDEPELRQIFFEFLPMRLALPPERARHAPSVVGQFLEWAGQSHLNPNSWKFPSLLDEVDREFPELLKRIGGRAVVSKPEKPYVRPGSKVGRNDPCPCGSGKKYKKCCADGLA